MRGERAAGVDWKYATWCGERAEQNKQLADWLKDYQRLLNAIENIKAEIETEKESMIQHNEISDLGLALEIIYKHIGEGE